VLREKGAPLSNRFYYRDVTKVEQTGPRNCESSLSVPIKPQLPLIIGQPSGFSRPLTGRPGNFGKWETTLGHSTGQRPLRIFPDVKVGRSTHSGAGAEYWVRNHPTTYRTANNFRYDAV